MLEIHTDFGGNRWVPAASAERIESALAQAVHTLNRIYIRDCLDPSETARAALWEIQRRREDKG